VAGSGGAKPIVIRASLHAFSPGRRAAAALSDEPARNFWKSVPWRHEPCVGPTRPTRSAYTGPDAIKKYELELRGQPGADSK